MGGGGGDVFSGCTSLKSVKLSDNLTRIESNTFYGFTSLESIHFLYTQLC